MTQYNTLNARLSNSQLSKLKSGIENYTEVTLKLSSNVVGDSNDENNFPHKLLSTNTQVSRIRWVFANSSLGYIKLSKTQLRKKGQSRGFLGKLLGLLLKTELPLMRNVLKPVAKSVFIPLGLTAAASPTDAAIYKKNVWVWSGMTTLKILNEEMNNIMKIVKSLEESNLLIKDVSKTKVKQNDRKKDFQYVIRYIRC